MYVYITTLNGYIGSTYNYIFTVSGYIGPPSGVGSVMRGGRHIVTKLLASEQ